MILVIPQYPFIDSEGKSRRIHFAIITKEGHKIANDLAYDYSIVLGSEKYYPKMAYLPAINYGIMPSFEAPSKNFMACKLNEKAANISGIVEYAKEFGI